MTFCCENTRKAYELIGDAKSVINSISETNNFSAFMPTLIIAGSVANSVNSGKKQQKLTIFYVMLEMQ